MTIQVMGIQWWWQVMYQTSDSSIAVTTANEIDIPVGRPVQLRLLSNDVIHSFWVPNLHGKTDLIPSRVNTQWIRADKPGVYRGQCAEFCGLQHAHMIVYVLPRVLTSSRPGMTGNCSPPSRRPIPLRREGNRYS